MVILAIIESHLRLKADHEIFSGMRDFSQDESNMMLLCSRFCRISISKGLNRDFSRQRRRVNNLASRSIDVEILSVWFPEERAVCVIRFFFFVT